MKFLLTFCLILSISTLSNAAPILTSAGSTARSIQFTDSNGDLWGTNELTAEGNAGRKLVKFSGIPNGAPVIFENTFTEALKPKGSNQALGFPTDAYSVIHEVWQLPDGNLLFSTVDGNLDKGYLYKLRTSSGSVGNNAPTFDNKQAVMNIGERNGVHPTGIRTLHQASLSVATIKDQTVLFLGEYNVNTSRVTGASNDWVGVWKSTDLGDTWSKVVEWNTNGQHQTYHIHGIRYNPYNQWVYLLLGDDTAESGIIAWDGFSAAPPDNTPLNLIGTYPGWKALTTSPSFRTGDIVFTPTQCVWIPDTDVTPAGGLFGQRANHDLTGDTKTAAVPYVDAIPPIFGYRDQSTGNIFWASFRIDGAAEQTIHLWTSSDSGTTWDLASKAINYHVGTALPHSLFKAPWGQLVLSGILGTDFVQPPAGARPLNSGSSTFYDIGSVPVNTAPVANNDTATTVTGAAVTINVLANDTDAQSNIAAAPASITIVTSPANGSVLAAASGIVYTPSADFSGTNTFTYTVKDTGGLISNAATVTVTVNPVNTAPVANPDNYSLTADTTKSQFKNILTENGVAANDLPTGNVNRIFTVVTNLKRISGSGTGTIALEYFEASTGRFNYTLTVSKMTTTKAQIQAAKRGIYQFTYTLTLNGITTPATTVTITVS